MIKKIQHISYCILTTLLMVACQKEELHEGPCKVRFVASVQDEVSVTRTETEYTNIKDTNIPAFTAPLYVSYGDTHKEFAMTWNGSSLSSTAYLEAWTEPYWFYGYAPKFEINDVASASFENTTLTLSSIPALYDKDLLVIKPCSTTINTTDVGKTKTVSLQMDHLLAKITPCFYLNSTYASMRSIRIKKVEFLLPSASYTATVAYNDDENENDDYEIDWGEPTITEGTTEITTYKNDSPTDEQKLGATEADMQEYGCCYIVPAQSASTLKMKVTYDVYDKSGTLTREDATATNQIKKLPTTLVAGTNYKLNIQIIPTYLYVLSDNDESSVLVIPNN